MAAPHAFAAALVIVAATACRETRRTPCRGLRPSSGSNRNVLLITS
jgi:hypothetical protein